MVKAIEKAMSIFSNRDWYYMMADYGYAKLRDRAKAEMREFVECCNEVDDDVKKKALKDLWVLKYDYVNSEIGAFNNKGINEVEYEKEKKSLLSIIGLA